MKIYNPFSKKQRKAKSAEKKLNELIQIKTISLYNQYSQLILHSTDVGTGNDVEDEIIVSLTSFSKRLDNVAYTIESLMQQTLKADRIQLWLGADKTDADTIPLNLRKLEKRGLEICFGDKDFGPYTKYYYAMKNHPNSLVITIDDDIFYPTNMIEKLYYAYKKEPSYIHCHRGHKMIKQHGSLKSYREWEFSTKLESASFAVFPTGVGGVLYFPGALNKKALASDEFLQLSPNADDIWLKAMSLLNNTKCKTIPRTAPFRFEFPNIPYSQEVTLKRSNKNKEGNNDKISRVFNHFGLNEKI